MPGLEHHGAATLRPRPPTSRATAVDAHDAVPAHGLRELEPRAVPVDVVAIGASAGGVEALIVVVSHLPKGFRAAVLVVLHVAESGTSVLPAILSRSGPLQVTAARDGEAIEAGRVYIAPAAHHLTVEGGKARLLHGPRENGHRPSVDALFRSAARAYGPRVAGVVLSGTGDDGTAGLREIKRCGGTAIVQEPREALYASMPRNAMTHVAVDAVLPLRELGFALARLSASASGPHPVLAADVADAGLEPGAAAIADLEAEARLSRFTCPDCGGVLFQVAEGTVERFVCTVGHAYSAESLLEEQAHRLECALWAAIRSLEDRAVLLRRIERQSREAGRHHTTQAFERNAQEATAQAQTIRAAVRRVITSWRTDDAEHPHHATGD